MVVTVRVGVRAGWTTARWPTGGSLRWPGRCRPRTRWSGGRCGPPRRARRPRRRTARRRRDLFEVLEGGDVPAPLVAHRPVHDDLGLGSRGTAAAAPPGAPIQLFGDESLNYSALDALGAADYGVTDVGEVLTAVAAINAAGQSLQAYTDTFLRSGDRLAGLSQQARARDRVSSGSTRCERQPPTLRHCSTSSAPMPPAVSKPSSWPAAGCGTGGRRASGPSPSEWTSPMDRRPFPCGSSGPTTTIDLVPP